MMYQRTEEDWTDDERTIMKVLHQHAEARPGWDEDPALLFLFQNEDGTHVLEDAQFPTEIWAADKRPAMVLYQLSMAAPLVVAGLRMMWIDHKPRKYLGAVMRCEMWCVLQDCCPEAIEVGIRKARGEEVDLKDVSCRAETRDVMMLGADDQVYRARVRRESEHSGSVGPETIDPRSNIRGMVVRGLEGFNREILQTETQ